MSYLWWAFGTWFVAVASGTTWSSYFLLPWDSREGVVVQISGLFLFYAIRVTPLVLGVGISLRGADILLSRLASSYAAVRSPLTFLGVASVLGLITGSIVGGEFPALSAIGAISAGTGVIVGRPDRPLPMKILVIILGFVVATGTAILLQAVD